MPHEQHRHSFSVRSLVPDPDLSAAGRETRERVHERVQAKLRRKYRTFHSEVTLSATVETASGPTEVHGRVDGFRITPSGVVLYEIKPVSGSAKAWVGSDSLLSARWQLQLYLELAQRVKDPPWAARRIIGGVLHLVGEQGRESAEPVEPPAGDLLSRRVEIALAERIPIRRWPSSLTAALAEFTLADATNDRPVQRAAGEQMAAADKDARILLALPPGAGKTRLALRRALQTAAATSRQMFWITIKARGRDIVLREVQRYIDAGLPLRILWKTVASRLCTCDGSQSCDKYVRTLEYLFLHGVEHWKSLAAWMPEDMRSFAEERDLCAYELSRRLEPLADLIIADVNYLLEPSTIRERQAVLVFDEAQNLAARVLDYSRVFISRHELKQWLDLLPPVARRRYRSLISPDFSEGPDASASRELWTSLAQELQRRPVVEFGELHAIRRLRAMLERFPHDYILRWCRGPDGTGWVGTLPDSDLILAEILAGTDSVLALTGSPLSSLTETAWQSFDVVDAGDHVQPPVAIIPLLSFSYPISLDDHEQATDLLRALHESYGATVAVFGQNRPSNEMIAWRLRARGFTSLLDTDIAEDDWELLRSTGPDFLMISLGGNLAESVNPPAGLFSCGIVLAPGHRPTDIFERIQMAALAEAGHEPLTQLPSKTPEAVSRIVQAAGRLQRSPQELRPVFLVNKSFARSEFLDLWPRQWYRRRPQELLFDNLAEAQAHVSRAVHAR